MNGILGSLRKPAVKVMKWASEEVRWLARGMRPFWPLHARSFVLVVLGNALALIDPLVIRWLIDSALPARSMSRLSLGLLAMLVSLQGRVFLTAAAGLSTFSAAQLFLLSLRKKLLKRLSVLSADFHLSMPDGAKTFLVRDTTQEITLVAAEAVPGLIRIAASAALTITVMVFLNPTLTATALPLIPIFFFAKRSLLRRLQATSAAVQAQRTSLAATLDEQVRSALQAQLLCCEKRLLKKTYVGMREVFNAERLRKRAELQYVVLSSGMTVALVVASLGLGGVQVIRGMLSIGTLVAFYTYLLRLLEPISASVEMGARIQRVGASIRPVMNLLAHPQSISDADAARTLTRSAPYGLEFRHVEFRYPSGRPVLDDLNLVVHPGERLALVGCNGAGKSTVAKLIARLYDANRGSVRINGDDIRTLRLASLRQAVAYLPQTPVLFDASIEENLMIAKPSATVEELLWALELSQCYKVVERLPGGLRAQIGPDGRNLSGGERQSLAIARTILKKPRLLMLDESTSCLDTSTEQSFFQQLDRFFKDATIIVTSHRLSALTWVDRIAVLDRGKIVECGTHSELCARKGLYAWLYDHQDPDLMQAVVP